MNRFQPGDHLQVWRGLYHHHGIYVSDDRVIQFGSGVTLRDKSRTAIDAPPPSCHFRAFPVPRPVPTPLDKRDRGA